MQRGIGLMICTSCHASLNRHARFCSHCGAAVTQEKQAASQSDADIPLANNPDSDEHPVLLHAHSLELEHYKSVPAAGEVAASKEDPEAPATAETAEAPQNRHSIPELPTVTVDLEHLTNKNNAKDDNIPDVDSLQNSQQPLFLTTEDLRTQPVPLESIAHPELLDAEAPVPAVPDSRQSQLEQANPLLYYKLNTTTKGSQMLPAVVRPSTKSKRKGRAVGCLFGCLTTRVILLLLLGASWVFIARPYLHNIAATQINQALDSGVKQIPANFAQQIPSGQSLPINENLLNNLIALNLSPSSPVKNPTTTITDQNVKLAFDVYGYSNDITLVPAQENGNLVATDVHVDGPFGLIMSPDEMTQILNQHFSAAQKKIGRVITNVQLKNQEVDLTFG